MGPGLRAAREKVARAAMAALGVVVGLVARLWIATVRARVHLDPRLGGTGAPRPWVLAFWHGTQLPLFAWRRRRPTAVLVSHSKDGALQAQALRRQGLVVLRGSSSRGGARGLLGIVEKLRAGTDAAFAVDGPRGPYGVAKGGAAVAASAAGASLVPVGAAAERALVLSRTWDRFVLPWPFTRVELVLGAPVDAGAPDAARLLGLGIDAANRAARAALAERLGERGGHRDGVDLDLRAAGERGDLDGGAGGLGRA